MASRVAALLLLGIICFGFATGDVIKDCCLSVSNKHLPAAAVKSYVLQKAGEGCSNDATVIFTKRGRTLCLVHPDGNEWMQRLLDTVDQRRQ